MNLAEIRKKAEFAKKTAPVTVAAPAPEVEIAESAPEQALEEFTEEAELFASATEAFNSLAELTFEPEELSLPDDLPLPVNPEVYPEVPAVKVVPDTGAQLSGDVAEKPVPISQLPGAVPAHPVYNPLATILSGREEAADAEEVVAFQQMSFSSGDVEEYLCFRVADEEYALNIMSIKEIIKPRGVTEVPRMPNFISGVISLRGVIIPVMDMRLRLSLPVRGATGRERIIVLRTAAGFCGVLVDEVVQVARVRKADIEAPPAVLEEIDRDFVRGLGHFDNRMLILLNLETITDISIH